MSIVSHSQAHSSELRDITPVTNITVPASIAVLLIMVVAAAIYLPPGLILPAVALGSAVISTISGLSGCLATGRLKYPALMISGIFALAAISAAILGDPDQVALLVK